MITNYKIFEKLIANNTVNTVVSDFELSIGEDKYIIDVNIQGHVEHEDTQSEEGHGVHTVAGGYISVVDIVEPTEVSIYNTAEDAYTAVELTLELKTKILNSLKTNSQFKKEAEYNILDNFLEGKYTEAIRFDIDNLYLSEAASMINEAIYNNTEFTPELIKTLKPNEVFVYGSNRQGILGGGAAFYAKTYFGAKDGIPKGMTGQCYGIVTKDYDVNVENDNAKSVPLHEIRQQIIDLYKFAKKNPDKKFLVTKIGSALAGYSIDEIAFCFKSIWGTVPDNVILPIEFV